MVVIDTQDHNWAGLVFNNPVGDYFDMSDISRIVWQQPRRGLTFSRVQVQVEKANLLYKSRFSLRDGLCQ